MPQMKDTRNATTNETAMETADRVSGDGKSHPAAVAAPTKSVGPDTHPSASHTYGSPIGQTVLRPRNGT